MRAARWIVLGLMTLSATPVAAQRVVEVQLAPPLLRLAPGAQVQVLATAYDREGAPVEARLIWSSTNINVATVDSLGRVYAVAPGLAIITAASDTATSRRTTGRTTVFVSSMVRSGEKRLASADTVPPAECAELEFGLRNPARACWDARPALRGSVIVAPPSTCTGHVAPVVLHVRVDADGTVREARTAAPSSCEAYRQMATTLLGDLCCRPAYRNGHPVAAWTTIVIRPPREARVIVTPPYAPTVPVPQAPRPPRTPAPGKQAPRP